MRLCQGLHFGCGMQDGTPHPFAQARACPNMEWALNRCFQDFSGPLLFVVLNAGLGVCAAFVEGNGGSFMSLDSAFCS